MKKDIYIIKNSVNNMVYIGQSKDVPTRWLSHVCNARYRKKAGKRCSLLQDAIIEFGEDKFHYEILEYQIENYNEREKYWIHKYNSIYPNGYNIAEGGIDGNNGFYSSSAIFKSKEEFMECVSDISSTKKSFLNIAKKYGCSPEVIHAINSGLRYKQKDFVYPLRNTNYKYSNEKVKQIIYSLKYETDITMLEIAKKYNIDSSQLSEINNGKIYFMKGQKYPIRDKRIKDLNKEIVKDIIKDIKDSDMCMKDIAIKYKVSQSTLSSINAGGIYIIEGVQYPIRRENDERNKTNKKFLDIDEIKCIIEELRGKDSVRDIAKRHGVTATTIFNINIGKTKKYVIEGYNYPIRK